jgi:hypothetical protein
VPKQEKLYTTIADYLENYGQGGEGLGFQINSDICSSVSPSGAQFHLPYMADEVIFTMSTVISHNPVAGPLNVSNCHLHHEWQ